MNDGPPRPGARGGQAEFRWDAVKQDEKHRENYLGHTVNAPAGRWQKNKDVHWYARDKESANESVAAKQRRAELKALKEAEEEALSVALGFAPSVKKVDVEEEGGAGEVPRGAKDEEIERLEKEERKREKEKEHRALQRAERELRREEKEREREEEKRSRRRDDRSRSRDKDDRRDHKRGRERDEPERSDRVKRERTYSRSRDRERDRERRPRSDDRDRDRNRDGRGDDRREREKERDGGRGDRVKVERDDDGGRSRRDRSEVKLERASRSPVKSVKRERSYTPDRRR